MKCLAICQTELMVRTLDRVLSSTFDVDFLVENRTLARRLHDAGIRVTAADCCRVDTYLKADLSPQTCVIIEDHRRRSLRRLIEAVRDAGGSLTYVLSTGASTRAADDVRQRYPDVAQFTLAELTEPTLIAELSRSLTRARVQQYQRYFENADRVLVLLHDDPDPDALASGLTLRYILRRRRATCTIGAVQPMTRPENLRMARLLDIPVDTVTQASFEQYDRIATVDVQPHYFDSLSRVDLVIDHHPEQTGYNAVFKDIRPDYGSTSTILWEHMRAVDLDVSERTATAMLYAIKSDTLFFARHTNRQDLEAFTNLYPLADPALIRKMEGAEITHERLEYVMRALAASVHEDQVFCGCLGEAPREDLITYAADFFLELEDTRWAAIAGIVGDKLVVSVRNLGYARNAGEFVKRFFADLGSAGGHRSLAKAVVPFEAFVEKYGARTQEEIARRLSDLAHTFLHEQNGKPKEVAALQARE
ncbi:MAG: DHH family phosphoesterase [Vicinamibacteraceae bacterium]